MKGFKEDGSMPGLIILHRLSTCYAFFKLAVWKGKWKGSCSSDAL